ncbi:MAG: DUF2892 domain-containing protein [Rhodobacter sp.]|nr:DUF2892 domain-containing protein [Rhodobacter sp.]
MTVNVGTTDRILRALLGVALILLPFVTGLTAGSMLLTYGAVAVGVVMLVVALTRVCPVYTVFGFKTCA